MYWVKREVVLKEGGGGVGRGDYELKKGWQCLQPFRHSCEHTYKK
jgi:hypothetical protein